MNHLILGMTESGKTTLARLICGDYRREGIETLVYDPMMDPRWSGPVETDRDKFLTAFWSGRRLAVFIDEGSATVGRSDRLMEDVFTRGRHLGHNVYLVSQRHSQINPTIRAQCSVLYLFSCCRQDAEVHAREWNNQKLLDACKLKRFEYLACGRFIHYGRHKVAA